MRDIKKLHPKLKSKAEELVLLCKSRGINIGIGECLRTKEEQDELYAKGRTAAGSIVTNAKGSSYSSMHQWGVAFDFYRNDGKGAFNNDDKFFEKVGNLGKGLGLFWGGDFKSIKDNPHFQLPDWGETPALLKKQFKKPDNFFVTWEDDSMTDAERKEFEEMKEKIKRLTEESEPYHYMAELPEYPDGTGRATIQKLKDMGIFYGASESDLNLSRDLFRCFVVNDRMGLYNKGGI